jgi:DNA-binding NarL/FixJ family response regulator
VVVDASPLQARCLTELLARSGVRVEPPVTDPEGLRTLLGRSAEPLPLVLLAAGFVPGERLPALVADITTSGRPCLVLLARRPVPLLPLLEAGALGVVPALAQDLSLVRTVEAGLRGEACVPRSCLSDVLRALITRRTTEQSALRRYRSLSRREREVLGLLAEGLAVEDIATGLVISQHTVRSHLSAALGKLGARSQAEAVRIVHEHDLGGDEFLGTTSRHGVPRGTVTGTH